MALSSWWEKQISQQAADSCVGVCAAASMAAWSAAAAVRALVLVLGAKLPSSPRGAAQKQALNRI